jgi:hypothetical protein
LEGLAEETRADGEDAVEAEAGPGDSVADPVASAVDAAVAEIPRTCNDAGTPCERSSTRLNS